MEAPPREIDAHPPSSSPATASSSSSPTEHAAMRIWAKRTRYASASSVFAASRPRGWAELPEDFLQSLVTRLGSFRDLLAFGATCRPWRDLLSARTPSLQPLLLHPSTDSQRSPWFHQWIVFQECTWRLSDPWRLADSSAASSWHSLLSLSDLRRMFFLRCSYGHLIFCDEDGFYIVNAFSGAKVVPPRLKSGNFTRVSYVTLTAPVASADSHLLVGSGIYLFQWCIGSDSWSEHSPKVLLLKIEQIFAFKGKTYALGSFGSFCIVHLSPSLIIQKFKLVFEEDRTEDLYWTNQKTWLVACGDALLLIKLEAGRKICSEVEPIQFKAFKLESLDAVNKKARWVKLDRLDNWAIFVSADMRCEALPCMKPERWGGKSNHIYFPCYQSEQPWAAVKLWKKYNDLARCLQLVNTGIQFHRLESTWILPGTFPRSGQR
ncbi:hypothetical protein CFC21_106669 [Triticum aestivum]|uniref:KIB1-4 beta-propeller domain-containing protein n=2 Tax=Triticum aestivum TaxID=4565 RepID=A0A9R1N9P6_WHEAT|nr:uncharacterized protein LOC123167686 isoform X2 [Triticum aestivum]KAF7105899.1 hypothetical protein CFC21_106669 [Triticum aestivum]